MIINVHSELKTDFVILSRWVFSTRKPVDEYFTTLKMTLKAFLLR